MIFLVICTLISSAYGRISVMYAHDKSTDSVAEQCLNEMYPNAKTVDFQETDEPCIIFCVLKKFGIINSNGNISLDAYKKHLHQTSLGQKAIVRQEHGSTCLEQAEASQHNNDVCYKAKLFNDCTRLYKIMLMK